MADALLRKMSGARERQSGRRIRFIFCTFILLRLYLAGNIGLLFRKVQSHCAEMASDTKRPCRSEQRQLSVLIRQGHSDGPDEAEAVSTLSRSLAPTPLTVTPKFSDLLRLREGAACFHQFGLALTVPMAGTVYSFFTKATFLISPPDMIGLCSEKGRSR